MSVFWLNLAVVFIFSLLARYTGKPVTLGPATIRPNKAFAFIALASLVLVSGLRSNIGDTEAYMQSYTFIGTDLSQALSSKDFGFAILVVLLNKVSSDSQLLIFATALITNVLIFRVIYRYANPFELGTFLYITAGSYMVSMNGIRQFLASAIIFAALKWLIDGSYKRYFIIVALASAFHLSALLMLPVYFVVRQKAWSWMTVFTMILTFVIFLFFKPFISSLFEIMGDNQYSHYQDFLTQSGMGANFIRTVVAAVPLVLAFFGRKRLRSFWPKTDYIVNMSMINFVFMIFATTNWIFARFSIYFGLYNLLLLPWIIEYVVNRGSKKIMYFSLVACYLIFFYYENFMSLRMIYKSNYLNF